MDFSGEWLGVGIAVGFIAGLLLGMVVQSWRQRGQIQDSRNYNGSNNLQGTAAAAPQAQVVPVSGLGPLQSAALRKKQAAPPSPPRSDTQQSRADNWKASGASARNDNDDTAAVRQVQITVQPADLPVVLPPSSTHPRHQRASSMASNYDVEDLDTDWEQLLGNVDAMLNQAGKPCMQPAERAVAVRKLVAATGTKGVDAALTAAVEEVLKARSWKAHASNR